MIPRTSGLGSATAQAVDPRMIQAVVKRLVKQRLEGDAHTPKMVLERVAGKPAAESAKRLRPATDLGRPRPRAASSQRPRPANSAPTTPRAPRA